LQKVANSILYFKLRRHGQKIRTQQQKNQSLSKSVEKKEIKNSFRLKRFLVIIPIYYSQIQNPI